MPYIDQITRGGTTYDIQDSATKAVAEAILPMIAYEELTTTATHAYTAGNSYFTLSGVLYKATADIAIGDNIITTGTGANATQVPGGVSGQVADLKSAFVDNTGSDFYTITESGKYISLSGTTTDINNPGTSSTGNSYYLIPCTAGDKFTVSAQGGESARAWGFVDNSSPNNILDKSNANVTINNFVITAPENAAYLIVNDKSGNGHVYKNELLTTRISDQFAEVNGNLALRSHNIVFYIGSNGNASWADYDTTPPYLNIGTNNYVLIIDNEQYTILNADILSAATSAGLTVSGQVISANSFAIYFDLTTNTVKALSGITTTANKKLLSKNPVIFCAHYKSVRSGLLLGYMGEKRLETAEKNIAIAENDIDGLQALIGTPMPSYYTSYMAAKRSKILDNMMNVGKDGETFIFITDIHWENNDQHSPSLVNYLLDNLNINLLLNGGDLINQGNKADMIETMREAIVAYQHRNILMPCAFGNHDSNENFSPAQPEKKFSVEQQYALMQKQAEKMVTYFTDITYSDGVATAGNWNFYFDVVNTKTRFIVIDTVKSGTFSKWADLKNCMLATPDGYNIVLMGHWMDHTTNNTAGKLATLCDGYNSRSSAVTIGSYTYDLSTAKGYVKLILGGHRHKDDNWYTPAGIPFVLIDSDNGPRSNATAMPYVSGTVTEQSFGVFTVNWETGRVMETKIGRGYNAIFNAGITSVSIGGTESLTASITPTAWNSSDETVATVANGTVTAVGAGTCIIKANDADTEEFWFVSVN